MNTRSSSWTGRSSRTLQECFGPYTDNQISEERADYCAAWWAALIVCAIVGLAVIGSTL